MEQGMYFYWVGWIVWTIMTFFVARNRVSFFIIVWILLLIMSFHTYFPVGHFTVSIGFILLLIGALYTFVLLRWKWTSLLITFIIMINYISLRIWENLAPIWFFIPALFVIPLIVSLISLLITRDFHFRLVSVLLGVSFGELFHSLILIGYYLNYEVVQLIFFDYLALMVLMIISIHFIRMLCIQTVQSLQMFIHNITLFK